MSRVVFVLLFGLAIIRRCASEEPKWGQTDSDKNKSESEPEARFGKFGGFSPQYPGPYGPYSNPIRPGFKPGLGRPGHSRPQYPGSCRCSFNCPSVIVGSCGKGRQYCCYNEAGYHPWGSQPYYPVSITWSYDAC